MQNLPITRVFRRSFSMPCAPLSMLGDKVELTVMILLNIMFNAPMGRFQVELIN